jgi:predicted RNA-binding protein Jag
MSSNKNESNEKNFFSVVVDIKQFLNKQKEKLLILSMVVAAICLIVYYILII